jgi:lipoic acid synthetase
MGKKIFKADISYPRLPVWLRRRVRENESTLELKSFLRRKKINTVCQSAGCPNIVECFQRSTATFMILGNVCTRHCKYCGVSKGSPSSVDLDEPQRIKEVVGTLKLRHVVLTSVTRDDLDDGGARHFAKTVEAIRQIPSCPSIEVLIPDFRGRQRSLEIVLESPIDVLAHNIETVPSLYPRVRPEADFERSLSVLKMAKTISPDIIIKSGLMLGLGESTDEAISVFNQLFEIGCDALSIGQYLPPDIRSYPVCEYITPKKFKEYEKMLKKMGFHWVQAGPYVRSSYHAEMLMSN